MDIIGTPAPEVLIRRSRGPEVLSSLCHDPESPVRSTLRITSTPLRPVMMNIELTSCCNQRCVYCSRTNGKTLSSASVGHMSEETWRHVKRAAVTVGYVMWTGFGETLLHPKWAEYMAELDALGIASGFSTNGTLLNDENCRVLADLTLGYHVNVSLDTLDESAYFALRKGALHRVTAGLRNLVAHRNRERVTVASVVTRSNFASLVDVPDMLAELGIREYVLMSLQEYRSGIPPGTQLLGQAFEHTLGRIEARARAAGIRVRVDVPHRLAAETQDPAIFQDSYVFQDVEPAGLTRACLVPWEIPFCDKDGNVFPCSNSTGSEACVMGNLRELPFEKIWKGDRFERFRCELASGNRIPAACRACTIQRKGLHPTVGPSGDSGMIDFREKGACRK